jgi:hypothetical protein
VFADMDIGIPTDIVPSLRDPTIQDNASAAIKW